jgi:hypothetical protein
MCVRLGSACVGVCSYHCSWDKWGQNISNKRETDRERGRDRKREREER